MGDSFTFNINGGQVTNIIGKIEAEQVSFAAGLPQALTALAAEVRQAQDAGVIDGVTTAAADRYLADAHAALALPEPARRSGLLNALRGFAEAVALAPGLVRGANEIIAMVQGMQ
ncbi:hypothetical protein AB0J82_21085 [Asanoa sp. NPDC049518]|uniref:hypothetical protein n=1 Tax=unclassified Asanoa TaxID=2685164 RepID=UPI003432A2F8